MVVIFGKTKQDFSIFYLYIFPIFPKFVPLQIELHSKNIFACLFSVHNTILQVIQVYHVMNK